MESFIQKPLPSILTKDVLIKPPNGFSGSISRCISKSLLHVQATFGEGKSWSPLIVQAKAGQIGLRMEARKSATDGAHQAQLAAVAA